jgi:hypothetical protein
MRSRLHSLQVHTRLESRFFQIVRSTPHDRRIIPELSQGSVASKAQQSAYLTGRVIVVDMRQGLEVQTDHAPTGLPMKHRGNVRFRQAVSPLEKVASDTSVVLRLVVGHHSVVTGTAISRETTLIRLVASERGKRPDLLAPKAVTEALRHVRPLTYLSATLGHTLAIARLGTALKTLFAVASQTVSQTLVTSELVCGLF